jgi:hypothetical protein
MAPVFRGIIHKANSMFKLCSELQGARGPQGQDNSSLSGNTCDLPSSQPAISVKKATVGRTRPRLFTPYEMAALLAPPSQGFTFRDYLIYNADVTLKKGEHGV